MTPHELTEDEYLAWRELPVTRAFLQALTNYSRSLEAGVKEAMWQVECLSPEQQCQLALKKGRSRLAAEAASLDFEGLTDFLEMEDE